jgi:hypothetical protein
MSIQTILQQLDNELSKLTQARALLILMAVVPGTGLEPARLLGTAS